MGYEFRLQDPGEGIHEAEVLEIVVAEGDHVKEGDNLLVAETDKAAVDIPSPVTGEITEIRISEGDIVDVGDVLMVFEEDTRKEEREPSGRETSERTPQEEEDGGEKEEGEDAERAETESGKERARDHGADTEGPKQADILATPAVRGIARERGVDLGTVSGSGPNGRILEEDVRAAGGQAKVSEERKQPEPETEDGLERVRLRSVRRTIAKRMAKAWREIPHVVHHDVVDITELERLRREQAGDVEAEGGKLTLTPFLLKALAGALDEHPRFNATFDAEREELTIRREFNIGVAIDTKRGLMVPVVHDVRSKSVLQLAARLAEISEAVKNERAERETLKGGTFTLTNVGAIGGTGFSPLINPPQVAIFGTARAELRQMFQGDLDDPSSVVALVLPLCVGFDHRVIDGADAARFMNTVKRLLNDPHALFMRG